MTDVEEAGPRQYAAVAHDGTIGKVWGIGSNRVLLTTKKSNRGYWLGVRWDVSYRPHEIRTYLSRFQTKKWFKEANGETTDG